KCSVARSTWQQKGGTAKATWRCEACRKTGTPNNSQRLAPFVFPQMDPKNQNAGDIQNTLSQILQELKALNQKTNDNHEFLKEELLKRDKKL
ncbi:hypothetical protein ABTN09_20210, partial [Acinetobacter baumannii]